MKRQQQRLQQLWHRELQRQQQQNSFAYKASTALGAFGQRLQQLVGPAAQQQLQQRVRQQFRKKGQYLLAKGSKLQQGKRQLVARLRQRLRLQQQQLWRQLQQQHSALQGKRIIWAESRRRKLAAALLLLQQQKAHLSTATAGAKEKLRGLWRRYGWTAVVSYAIVHTLTLLSLFCVASAVPAAKLRGAAAFVGLGSPLESDTVKESEKQTIWGPAVFAYFASKALAPLQIALAIWLTPALARLMGRRIDRLGGRAEAAASSAAGGAAAKAAAAATTAAAAAAGAAGRAAAAARRSWLAAKARRRNKKKS